MLLGNNRLLAAAGICLTVAMSKRHEKLGRCEKIISVIKKLLFNFIGTHVFLDTFDMSHKISLCNVLINERPTWFQGHKVFSPHTLDSAILQRSPAPVKIFCLSEFLLPKDRKINQSILELTAESKKFLNLIASQTASYLLNKKVNNECFQVGELVFVIDLILSKQPNSLSL